MAELNYSCTLSDYSSIIPDSRTGLLFQKLCIIAAGLMILYHNRVVVVCRAYWQPRILFKHTTVRSEYFSRINVIVNRSIGKGYDPLSYVSLHPDCVVCEVWVPQSPHPAPGVSCRAAESTMEDDWGEWRETLPGSLGGPPQGRRSSLSPYLSFLFSNLPSEVG